jgi:Domain of unknown function (DUF1996)
MSTPRPTALRPTVRTTGTTIAAAALSILVTGCQPVDLPSAVSSGPMSSPAEPAPGSLATSGEPVPSVSEDDQTASSAEDARQTTEAYPSSSGDATAGTTGSSRAGAVAGAPTGSEGSIFVVRCDTSHRAADDPIVAPGEPGGSHDHTFLGNTSTDAFSTTESLMASTDTSCDVPADLSAYWFPTVYQDGEPLDVDGSVYYLDIDGEGPLAAPPDGLRVVAGAVTAPPSDMEHGDDEQHTSGSGDGAEQTAADGTALWGFTCRDEHTDLLATPPADCTEEEPIAMRVNFPECWDGVNLDSADHRSHMAYRGFDRQQGGLTCPDTHPVEIPRLRLNVFLGTTDPTGITLSSGDVGTLHADVFVAWEGEALEDLVAQLDDGTVEPFPGTGTGGAAGTR